MLFICRFSPQEQEILLNQHILNIHPSPALHTFSSHSSHMSSLTPYRHRRNKKTAELTQDFLESLFVLRQQDAAQMLVSHSVLSFPD